MPRPVTPRSLHPMLFNIVEEMTIAAGLPKCPRSTIINESCTDALPQGEIPRRPSIAVTAGYWPNQPRMSWQGVVAHEMSHILHRDILYVTLAGVMWGRSSSVSNVYLRGMFRSSMVGSSRRYWWGGFDEWRSGQAIMMLIAVVGRDPGPDHGATPLYYALSRKREYMAECRRCQTDPLSEDGQVPWKRSPAIRPPNWPWPSCKAPM